MDAFLLLVLGLPFLASNVPSPDEIAKQAVEARAAIRTLHIKFTIQREWHDKFGTPGKGGVTKNFEVWLDGDHYRADVFTEGERTDRDMAVGRRVIYCRNCERSGSGVIYFEGSVVGLMPMTSRVAKSDWLEAFDPRILGVTGSSFLNLPASVDPATLRQEILSPERTPPVASEGTLLERPVWVLSSKWLRSGYDHKIVIDPTSGVSIIRIEASGITNEVTYSFRQVSEVKQDQRSGIWFPSKIVAETYHDRKLKGRDVYTITQVDINSPIDPAVFTLAGMGLPDGVEVWDPNVLPPGSPPRPRMQYRGGKIVPYQEEPPSGSPRPELLTNPTPVDPSVVPGQYRLWYAAAAVVFGLVAAILIWRAIRRAN